LQYHLLEVTCGTGELASLAASVKSLPLWRFMCVFTLTTPVRSMGDPTYTNFVDAEGKTAQAPDNLSSSSDISTISTMP
ncbi:hypothetical protein BDR05DRAFT_958557, partial [Suillus weaverae]